MESSIQNATSQPSLDSVCAIRKSFDLNQERAWASTQNQMTTLLCIRCKHKQFTTRQLRCLCLQALAFSRLVFDLLADSTPPLHQLRLDASELLEAALRGRGSIRPSHSTPIQNTNLMVEMNRTRNEREYYQTLLSRPRREIENSKCMYTPPDISPALSINICICRLREDVHRHCRMKPNHFNTYTSWRATYIRLHMPFNVARRRPLLRPRRGALLQTSRRQSCPLFSELLSWHA